ncbi:LITAF-like zinc ribbon domain-containing protein [Ditylenchus destructor]|nr:LITAF-like zinc ribbon domain-containing protein [Ditylenchus destructor]
MIVLCAPIHEKEASSTALIFYTNNLSFDFNFGSDFTLLVMNDSPQLKTKSDLSMGYPPIDEDKSSTVINISEHPAIPPPVYTLYEENPVKIHTHVPILGPEPQNMICTHCNREVVTNISFESGKLTWLIVAILCLTQ